MLKISIFFYFIQIGFSYVENYSDQNNTFCPPPNITCDNYYSHLKVWADIAVVYELKEPLDHMTKVITSIIRDDLFNYPGNPYAMGFDLNGLRASKVAPIPYPGAYYYVGVPAVYGEPLSNDDFVDMLGSYSSSYPPDNDTMSIDNGLSYVLYNLNQSRNAAESFLPRVVILVANNDSTVGEAKRTAQLLHNTNTLIITVSVDSDGDFSSLATGPNYVFKIRNVTDDIPVVQQIGNILVSMSSICFHDNGPPPKSSSTVTTQQAETTTQQAKTTTQQAKTTTQQAETTSQATTAYSMPSTTKLSNKFGKSMFSIIIAVLLIIFLLVDKSLL